MEAARELASAAAGTRFVAAPDAVRDAYGRFILDTLAVMAAGAAHPSIQPSRGMLVATGGTGAASAAGFATPVPAGVAALVNGAAMTVLQLQDGHRRARGHPMSHVLPVALALAEELGTGTQAFLDAVMAGYEVSARVGAALGGMQPLLHDTGTFGTIGAAVAAAHLLAPGACRAKVIEAAIGNAAAVALFPFRDTCMEGAGVHHLFVGIGSQTGLTAARTAAVGLAPSSATLERFFGPRAGENFDPGALVRGIGTGGWEAFEILNAYLKWHPVCAHLGPMVDCIDELRTRLSPFAPDKIASVEVAVYPVALQYDAPDPQSDLAARFSFRTTAALALVEGPLQPDSFAPARFMRPEVQAMAARVTLLPDPALGRLYPENRPTRVTLTLSDGRRESAEVRIPKGDGPAALTADEVRAKASSLLAHAWGRDQADAVLAALEDLSAAGLVNRLGTLLRRPFLTG